ncbi:UDP-2,3-diacylglucosamine diphosphatase [Thalassotalea euphylliae]|uniref:UDP-2,3-diacylglucosamine hydrolase n=1 Tax=Thalassotalea euphylliae TaxID=1655234 RepID=A0A3E0UEX9_9GAMM|nr:UDP-2,3-diacylglucosamine diphosphatase [Thalassotalea euphylliae]REL35117.1 UDP-2,3-diacylglucosamine diphosphatase [Thalassotalea euphylliae]
MSSSNTTSPVSYFIADLHLADNRPDITACFLSFLQNQAPKAEKLFILGDLFEYWLGDDDDSPFVETIANALKTLSTQTKIFFIQGNRDFLLGKAFAKRSGMTLLPDVEKISLYRQELIILHGDTLCTRDLAYQAFRKKSRSWWWQGIMKNLPLFLRKRIAENYRKKSAASTAMKSQDIMDVTQQEVERVMADMQVDLMIHGHTHRPDVHHFTSENVARTRVVLGDWYDQGSWLKFTPQGYELLNQPFDRK